jgi:hypothetical protein
VGRWPWRKGERIKVVIAARGERRLNTRHTAWNMERQMMWTISYPSDGGMRIDQETMGDWKGEPAPPDGTSAAYILALASSVTFDSHNRVVGVTLAPDAAAWAERRTNELKHIDHLPQARLTKLLEEPNMRGLWSSILGWLPGFFSHLKPEEFEEKWTRPHQYAMSGGYPVETTYTRKNEREPCAGTTVAPTCWRLSMIARANPEHLRAGYEQRMNRSGPKEVSRQKVRWVLAQDGAPSPHEVGLYDRDAEFFEDGVRPTARHTLETHLIFRIDTP